MAKKNILLKKGSYESAKISAKKAELISPQDIEYLKNHSYEEILKYLEEHGFKEVIDKSYLSYEGFYLIEKILNDYLSKNYTKFLKATSKTNQEFLEKYYLKYQIHNLMATIRCWESSEKELEPYLIGDNRRKEKYLKAFEMKKEEGLTYLSKKLGFDSNEVIKYYKKGLFELENYLYQLHYSQLINCLPKYLEKEDKKYLKYIKDYIDLLNVRTYLTLGEKSTSLFDDLFIEGGKLKIDYIKNNSINEIYSYLSNIANQKIKNPIDIDRAVGTYKQKGLKYFSNVTFGSPYNILGYFFTLEESISQIRKLLKAKYMGLSHQKIDEVLLNE